MCTCRSLIVQQNLIGIDAVVLIVTLSPLSHTYNVTSRLICEDMTSSTKREVHNLSQRRQKRTMPRPQVTYEQSIWWSSAADRQTNKQTHSSQYFAPVLAGERGRQGNNQAFLIHRARPDSTRSRRRQIIDWSRCIDLCRLSWIQFTPPDVTQVDGHVESCPAAGVDWISMQWVACVT